MKTPPPENNPLRKDLNRRNVPLSSYKTNVEEIRSDKEIATSEIRYRHLFESARDGILILNASTHKITDSNPFMSELLGYTRAELLGKELWQIGLLKDEKANRAAFRELQKNYYVRYEDLPLQSKTGQHHEVEFVSNLYEENGQKVIQCNIRDITKEKEVEEQLVWKTAVFESQVNSALDGIIIMDSEGRKILQNQKLNEMLAIPSHIVADRNIQTQIKWVSRQVINREKFIEKIAWIFANPDETSRDEIELINGEVFDR
ncbi:MAG: PAS domain S-box protein [Chthoniobacterales bacterium]